MSPPPREEAGVAKERLSAALKARLGVAMGMRPPVLEPLFGRHGAFALACAWLILHSIAAALAFWTIHDRMAEGGHCKLLALSLWGSLYFFVVIMISGVMTKRVLDIVDRDILRFASDGFAAAVSEKLGKQPRFLLVHAGPFAVAVGAWALGFLTLRDDIDSIPWASPDLLLWAGCSIYLYFATTRAMAAATFAFGFSGAFEQESRFLFPFGAVESPLAHGMAQLNRTLLTYWAMIFGAAATILLLAVPGAPFAGTPRSAYLFYLVPTVAFFSLGFGSFIYLRSEATVGTVLRRYTFERAEPLQREISDLLNVPTREKEATAAKIEHLIGLHDRIRAGGRYQSSVGTVFSLILPLVPVMIGLVAKHL